MASLIVLLLLLSGQSASAAGEDNAAMVKEGIKAGKEIIRFLHRNTDYNDLPKMSDQFTPFFDGLGGVISNPSMQEDYIKLEKDFSDLEEYYQKSKDLFNSTSLRDNYFPSLEIIDIYLKKFVDALKAPMPEDDDNVTSPYKEFTDSYKVYFDDSTDQILKGVNSTIPKTIMCHTSNDRYLARQYIKGMIFLLFKGVRVTMAFHQLDDSENYAEKSKLWVEKLKAVIDDTKRLDEVVKSNWLLQAETDIDLKFAKLNSAASFIAKVAYSFLIKKYYWRDWFVAVFSPVEFKKEYYHKFCDAFAFIKSKNAKQQWNVLIASVDKTKSKVKVNVGSMLKKIDEKNGKCKNWVGKQLVYPVDVFELQVPLMLTGSCDKVNVLGIMKNDVKFLEIKAAEDRLFRFDGKCLKMFAFG